MGQRKYKKANFKSFETDPDEKDSDINQFRAKEPVVEGSDTERERGKNTTRLTCLYIEGDRFQGN